MRGQRQRASRGRGDARWLVVVESSAKARTVERFLGRGWRVLACHGHVLFGMQVGRRSASEHIDSTCSEGSSNDAEQHLLREAERSLGLAETLAGCIRDRRNSVLVVHTLVAILRFRMLAIACGYEDADDCDALRADPLKLAVSQSPESGCDRMTAMRAPARIISRHRGGIEISSMSVDMGRSPRWRREGAALRPRNAPGGRRPPPPAVAPRDRGWKQRPGVGPGGRSCGQSDKCGRTAFKPAARRAKLRRAAGLRHRFFGEGRCRHAGRGTRPGLPGRAARFGCNRHPAYP